MVAGLARRRPEVVVLPLAAAAWTLLVLAHAGEPALVAAGHRHLDGGALPARVLGALPGWSVMVVAMMALAAAPAVRHVALNSFLWRRRRAVAAFLAAYLGAWTAFGVVALTGLALVHPGPLAGGATLAALLALAAVWHAAPLRRRLLDGCRRPVPLPPRGWPATRACLRFGARHAATCVGACWALMLPMVVDHPLHLTITAAAPAVIVGERHLRGARRRQRPVALALAAAALALAA